MGDRLPTFALIMRASAVVVLVAALAFFSCLSVAVMPGEWPQEWYGAWRYQWTNGSVTDSGWWFYNAPQQLLRQDINDFCQDSNGSLIPCSSIWTQSEMFLWTPIQDSSFCCKCYDNVGMTEPDWVLAFHPNVTEHVEYEPLNIDCNVFSFNDENGNPHQYFASWLTNLPVALAGGGNADEWLDTLLAPTPEWAFALPWKSCELPCPSTWGCAYNGSGAFDVDTSVLKQRFAPLRMGLARFK